MQPGVSIIGSLPLSYGCVCMAGPLQGQRVQRLLACVVSSKMVAARLLPEMRAIRNHSCSSVAHPSATFRPCMIASTKTVNKRSQSAA
jgi:hypothetical protein